MKKLLLAVACLLTGSAFAQIRVDVQLPSILFPAPPPLVEVEPGVQVVQDYDQEVFYVDSYYWNRRGDHWYRTNVYTGGWVEVEPRYVPQRLVFYEPGRFRHWRNTEEQRRDWYQWRERHEDRRITHEREERYERERGDRARFERERGERERFERERIERERAGERERNERIERERNDRGRIERNERERNERRGEQRGGYVEPQRGGPPPPSGNAQPPPKKRNNQQPVVH